MVTKKKLGLLFFFKSSFLGKSKETDWVIIREMKALLAYTIHFLVLN